MAILTQLVGFILHIDVYLRDIVANYGAWTYAVLFVVVFCETGLVVTPFLPGDSLLFAAAALAANSALNVWVLWLLLIAAAVLGDASNYFIGHKLGPAVLSREDSRVFKKEYLAKTHAFYERYGGSTIIVARFVPIVRTFAPFLAGVGAMTYRHFFAYNVVGGVAWVSLFVWGGYLFGNTELVKHNFTLVIVAIVLISLLPAVVEFVRHRLGGSPASGEA
ncbi:MAG TPA: DedA family protein [Coriobacteriia bacterium]|jgi:membrane-associated protein